ncbi:MAG: hypothetical protein HYX76_03840 [Acidobacteria bacterium]|nr:hypothetical protein [Acidobacteriota bacterium]
MMIRSSRFQAALSALVLAAFIGYAGLSASPGADQDAQSSSPTLSDIRFGPRTFADFSALAGEPFIRVDKQDNIFVSAPFGFSTTVSLLWRSSDGGRSFIPLGTPIVRDAVTGPGGGDTHQDVDDNNWFYYVDLSAACVTAAVSTDKGNTFPPERTNPIVCVSPTTPTAATDDRQWVGAFGDGIAYATWRQFTATGLFYLFKTTNGGLSWDGGRTIGTVGQSGPLQVDKQKRKVVVNGVQRNGIILYQIFFGGGTIRLFRIIDLEDGSPLIVENKLIASGSPAVFPVLTIDKAGNLYATWSQGLAAIFLTSSTNRGDTWSTPVRVNPTTLSGTNIMPWIVTGDPGRVDIVWYRSPLAGNPNNQNSVWDIHMAQSLNALDPAPAFTLVTVNEDPIHRGEICTAGLNCDLAVPMRDRGFLEFPSIDIDSQGAAVITYNDNTNQAGGAYVMVTKQTRGPSLYSSVGLLPGDSGSVGITQPSAGLEVLGTRPFTVTGTHTLPPLTYDNDEGRDARFPDHGLRIGDPLPAMDVQQVSVADDAANLTVKMKITDLTTTALAAAPAQSGGDGVLYLAQWEFNEKTNWVAAEIRGTQPVFYTGSIGVIRSATSKKYMTFNPDAAASRLLQGRVTQGAPGTIEITVPRALVGNPANGASLYSVTGYAISERGPLVPVTAGDPVVDPTSFPIRVDSAAAFTYVVGEGPQPDGVVEISLDDETFASPKMAAVVNVLTGNNWQLTLNPPDLTPGPHTLYARQRVSGLTSSPTASVNFIVTDTTEQIVDALVRLEAMNFAFVNETTSFDLALKNVSSQRIIVPIRAEIAEISSASGTVTAANADNGLPGSGAFWHYSDSVGDEGILSAGETSGKRNLIFNNPAREGFTVYLTIYGHLDHAGSTARRFESGAVPRAMAFLKRLWFGDVDRPRVVAVRGTGVRSGP